MREKIISIFLVLTMILALFPNISLADNDIGISQTNQSIGSFQGEADFQPDFSESEALKASMSTEQKKLSYTLLQLTDSQFLNAETSSSDLIQQMMEQRQIEEAPVTYSANGGSSSGFNVHVYIKLNQGEDFSALSPYVPNIENKDEQNSLAVAWVDINTLEDLAALNEVQSVREVIPPIVKTGTVTSEGDAILQADLVRAMGADGSGIKIGIISDGVDHYSSSVSSGDLPSDVTILSNTVGGDEGTAMLEIIYDLAPAAQLYFHDCGSSVLDFNDAIDALADAGCDVICDDIGWLAEPFFEDGVVAQHIEDLISTTDIIYVTAAGNSADTHYQGLYKDYGDGSADFRSSSSSSSYPYLYVHLAAGESVTVVMQWDDPFGGSGNDYELSLFNDDTGDLLDQSLYEQNGDDDPLEFVQYYNNTGSAIEAVIVAYEYDAPEDKTLEIYISGNSTTYTTNIVSADSIYGHPAVPGVIACGALNDSSPNSIAYYSSCGPVTTLTGTRQKPDICGIDGVSITGAGDFGSYSSGSYSFYGTSAAAPHIAAVIALLESRFPSMDTADIKQMLLDNGVDLGAGGYDNVYGYGRGDALAAAQSSLYVTFDSQGGSSVDGQLIENGEKIVEPTQPTKTDWDFGGWYKESDCINPWNFADDTVTADTTLFAKWSNGHTYYTIDTNGTYDISDYGDTAIVHINSGLTVTLTNVSETYYDMQIECGEGVTLTIDDLRIQCYTDDTCALSFTGSGNQLIATGYNTLRSGANEPGIRVEEGTSLDISGTGYLEPWGGNYAAGLGGGNGKSCGSVTINGVRMIAGGHDGAGIGGGYNGAGGTITIGSGTVRAEGYRGAGIGGGVEGSGGTVEITGGRVFVDGNEADYDIGCGTGGSGGTLSISGDAAVFLKNGTSISPITSTHELVSTNIITDDTVFGKIDFDVSWDPPIYAYVNTTGLYYLTYDGNGEVDTEIAPYYDNTTAVLKSGISAGDLVLVGWNTKADGTGITYFPGSSFTVTSDITLYAVWWENFSGSGTETDPYLIETAQDLIILSRLVNSGDDAYIDKYYLQTADIDLSTYESWIPIGSAYNNCLLGTYDGGHHTISGMHIDTSPSDSTAFGLFGYLQGTVKDLDMAGGSIHVTGSAGVYVGSIVGYLQYNGIIQNCMSSIDIDVSSTSDSNPVYAGGIVGYSYRSDNIISDCINTGSITGSAEYIAYTGGIAGTISDSTQIIHCTNSGTIYSEGYIAAAGGIAAHSSSITGARQSISECGNTGEVTTRNSGGSGYSGGIIGFTYCVNISNCFNTGAVSEYAVDGFYVYVGGIAGRCWTSNSTIHYCYNVGKIAGEDQFGGIVGYVYGTTAEAVSDCYYADTCAVGIGYGVGTVVSKTLEELKQQATFEGFDFTDTWEIIEGERFPILQNTPFTYVSGIALEETLYLDVGGSGTLVPLFTPSTASNQNVTWETSNESIATVEDGVVTLISDGTATITVTSQDGGFSDTCEVMTRIPVTSVTLSSESETMIHHDTLSLTATVLPEGASYPDVTWSTSDGTVATVSQSGLVTAVGVGGATITATADGVSKTCIITVDPKHVTSVTISSESETMIHHDTLSLTATVLPEDASYPDVTWSTSDGTVATVTQSGLVTAIGVGDATITATADGVSNTYEITVTPKSVTGVALTSSEEAINQGDTTTLTAVLSPADATNQSVNWSSNNEDVATVNASGVITAVEAGTATITVTTEDGGFTDTCTVTVKAVQIESSVYTIDRDAGLLTDVSINTSAAQLIANLTNDAADIKVYDKGGVEYTGDLVASGMVVKLVFGGIVKDELTISILGDVSGDGMIDINDILYIRADILNTYTLSDYEQSAADVNGDSEIDINDILYIRAHILGTYNIHA